MKNRGFTLLEILVATAILGIILVTVYGVLSRTLSAKIHAESRADLYASGREVVLKMADELEGALPPTAGRDIAFMGVSGEERVPTDAVQFNVVVRRLYGPSQTRGGRAMVSYSLDPLPDTPNLFALRRQEQMLTEIPVDVEAPDDAEGVPVPVVTAVHLLDQVAGLRLRYLDAFTDRWLERWDTTVELGPNDPPVGLPAAVEVTLFLMDENGGIHDFGTIVDLPLANLAPPTPRS